MNAIYDAIVYVTLSAPVALAGYLIGSIPFAYIIVRAVTGEDITLHGSGNIGAMNVRRSTDSWGWFIVAMLADGLKGLVPVMAAKTLLLVAPQFALRPAGSFLGTEYWFVAAFPMAAMAGVILGHNYSLWMAILKRGFHRTGKGLAAGGGALLAYDWRYFVVVAGVALIVIATSRYMLAGQVAAAVAFPVIAIMLRSPDWPFAVLVGLVVYAAHHKRFMGLLRGREPKFYIHDTMGPRG